MSKHHLHEDPDRTTTVGMARYAVDFFKAALAADEKLGLETGYETVAPVPVMFLAGQSIELILKSYFIHKGISLRDIRLKYGHGLQKSLTDAIELGLSNIVSLTEEDIYSSKQLQYIVTGAKTFPVFGPIETVTRKLLFAVGYEVGFPTRDIGNVI